MRGFLKRHSAISFRISVLLITVLNIARRPDFVLLAPYQGPVPWTPYLMAVLLALSVVAVVLDVVAVVLFHRRIGRQGSPWRSVRCLMLTWMVRDVRRALRIAAIRKERLAREHAASEAARRESERLRSERIAWIVAQFRPRGFPQDVAEQAAMAMVGHSNEAIDAYFVRLDRYRALFADARRLSPAIHDRMCATYVTYGPAHATDYLQREKRYGALREEADTHDIRAQVDAALAEGAEDAAISLLQAARALREREVQLVAYAERVAQLRVDIRSEGERRLAVARDNINVPREYRKALHALDELLV